MRSDKASLAEVKEVGIEPGAEADSQPSAPQGLIRLSRTRAPAHAWESWEAACIVLGATVALVGLHVAFDGKKVDYETLALGEASQAHWATVDGEPINCEGFELEEDRVIGKTIAEIDDCIAASVARGAKRSVIWLGNSQVFAINQMGPSDVTAPPFIHDRLQQRGLDLVTFSYPNANQQEHLAVYAYAAARLPVKAVLVNLVYDDFREDGVRARLQPTVKDEAAQRTLEQTPIGLKLIADAEAQAALEPESEKEAVSLQERSESALTDWLNQTALWSNRVQARGDLLNNLYRLRNLVLNINPQSKRRMIRTRYAANMEALTALLRDAQRREVTVLGFIVPLRNDVAPPYDMADYRRFIAEMGALFARYGQPFRNLENTVPSRYWGYKESTSVGDQLELDFMHFQAPGHALLASALTDFILDAELTP